MSTIIFHWIHWYFHVIMVIEQIEIPSNNFKIGFDSWLFTFQFQTQVGQQCSSFYLDFLLFWSECQWCVLCRRNPPLTYQIVSLKPMITILLFSFVSVRRSDANDITVNRQPEEHVILFLMHKNQSVHIKQIMQQT